MKDAKLLYIFIVLGIAQVSTGVLATPPPRLVTEGNIPEAPPAPGMRLGTRATSP